MVELGQAVGVGAQREPATAVVGAARGQIAEIEARGGAVDLQSHTVMAGGGVDFFPIGLVAVPTAQNSTAGMSQHIYGRMREEGTLIIDAWPEPDADVGPPSARKPA